MQHDPTGADAERQARIFFLESLERVDRAIRKAGDVEAMLGEVLAVLLQIFRSDRAWLLHPCDPDAPSFRIPMERTQAEYPGALANGVDLPMVPGAAEAMALALESNAPVTYDPVSGRPVPFAEEFHTRSQITVALRPRLGKPWLLGMHQCSHNRVWTGEDQSLFVEIGRRVADSLSSLLYLRDLRRSEERYRELVEGTSDLIVQLDDAARITYVNRLATTIFGLPPDECLGMSILDFVHPDDLDRTRTALASWISGRIRSSTIENRQLGRAGQSHEMLWTINLRYDDQGRVRDIGGIARDIGEMKRAEQDRLRLERQVQHAQKLEGLGLLAGGIAHDFNNLLVGVLGNAELAQLDLPANCPAQGYLHDIQTAALRAAELARQMLAYSGRGRAIVETISLNGIVQDMMPLLAMAISKKAVLSLKLADDLPAVQADPTQIRQVFMNLVTNASEALGEQGGVITISTGVLYATPEYLEGMRLGSGLPEGDYLWLEVADTGCGMTPETLDRIFEPFFTTKFTGRGLGLAAVSGIVRAHGGAIRLTSEPGVGTAFRVLLPCTGREMLQAETRLPTAAWRGEGTVLVVDDEEPVRRVSQRVLEEHGFQVLLAQDGEEGVRLLGQHARVIRAVLLDMTMPRMGGLEAFREMRRLLPGVRVILTSGYDEQEAARQFADEGLAGFIHKPFRITELLETLRIVLEAPLP